MNPLALPTTPFEELHAAVRDRLREDEWFVDLPILTEDAKDLDFEIDKALLTAGVKSDEYRNTSGAAILILSPAGRGVADAISDSLELDVTVRLEIWENPVINRGDTGTGKTANQILWRVLRRLQGHQFGKGDRPAVLREFQTVPRDDDGVVLRYVDFEFRRVIPTDSENFSP